MHISPMADSRGFPEMYLAGIVRRRGEVQLSKEKAMFVNNVDFTKQVLKIEERA